MKCAIFSQKKKKILMFLKAFRCLFHERKYIIIDPKLLKSFSKIKQVSRTGIIFGNTFVHKLKEFKHLYCLSDNVFVLTIVYILYWLSD